MEKYPLNSTLQKQVSNRSTENSSELLNIKIRHQLLIAEARGATDAAKTILILMDSNSSIEYNDAIIDAYFEALGNAIRLEEQVEKLSQQVEV